MTSEWTCLFGFKSKFNDRRVLSKNYVFHEVAISGEGSDEGPNKLFADGQLPLQEAARNLNRHIVRVVGHDAVLIRSAPRGVVLDHECFDIKYGSECSRGRHSYLIRFAHISQPNRARWTGRLRRAVHSPLPTAGRHGRL